LGSRPFGWGVVNHQRSIVQTRSFPTCVTMPNLVVLGQTVWCRKESQNFWDAGVPPLWNRGMADPPPRNTPLPYARALPCRIVRFRSKGTCVITETHTKNWPLSRSFKVIGTDTHRLGTYDFLLTFHSI